MDHLNQIKIKPNKLFILLILLFHGGFLNLQILQAQLSPNGNTLATDASITQLKLSNFTYEKNGANLDCTITCTGNISYTGKKEAKNVKIDYNYKFMSPNSGLKLNSKTVSGKIKMAKIIPDEEYLFTQVIKFKIPVAVNNTSYPDPDIYLCNDLFTAKLSRVGGEVNVQNNIKKWKGQNCIF